MVVAAKFAGAGRDVGLQPGALFCAIGYATFFSRSHDAVIRIYDDAGNVIETYEQASFSACSFADC
jgi:hypothetical protein